MLSASRRIGTSRSRDRHGTDLLQQAQRVPDRPFLGNLLAWGALVGVGVQRCERLDEVALVRVHDRILVGGAVRCGGLVGVLVLAVNAPPLDLEPRSLGRVEALAVAPLHESVEALHRPPRAVRIVVGERRPQLARDGQFNRLGLPRALAGARMLLEFADVGYATIAPLALQRAGAAALLGVWREYAFVDEWDVAAAPEAVYDVLVDGHTYPRWWRPVYIDVETDGPPVVGSVSNQHFKGRLPYHLHTRSKLTRLIPGALIEAN